MIDNGNINNDTTIQTIWIKDIWQTLIETKLMHCSLFDNRDSNVLKLIHLELWSKIFVKSLHKPIDFLRSFLVALVRIDIEIFILRRSLL